MSIGEMKDIVSKCNYMLHTIETNIKDTLYTMTEGDMMILCRDSRVFPRKLPYVGDMLRFWKS